MSEMTGGGALAEALVRMGTNRLYGIIGTSNIGFVDSLYQVRDRIRYISCRHEQVAASMADTEGRLTGRPGVALVHSGGGALNAAISMGNARKDCSPMMVISGAVKHSLAGSDGMLELDHVGLFAPLCKGTFRIDCAADVPSVLSKAYRMAMSGARGPVMIEVPEDVWGETTQVDLDSLEFAVDPPPPVQDKDVAEAIELLSSAKLPMVLAGGGVAYSNSSDKLLSFIEALGVPVVTTGNGRGVISETHPLSLGRAGFGGGNPVADKALENADAIVCLGAGISDMTTYEYTLPITAADIMVFNISGNYTSQAPPARVFACDVGEFLSVALERLAGKRLEPRPGWEEALSQARVMWDGLCQIALSREGDLPAGARVARTLDELLPHDTIVSVGAGTHLLYAMDFMPSRNPLTFMSTVNFGSMGFGFAANLASRLVFPDRSAIAMLGDGDFMMTIQDLETAVREDIPVKVFVMNDSQYRVLNIRQKLQFGGRIHGTEHGNPDFAALARDFGAAGYRLDRDSDTRDVLEKALAEKGPTVIDVIIDQDDLPPLNIEANLRMSM